MLIAGDGKAAAPAEKRTFEQSPDILKFIKINKNNGIKIHRDLACNLLIDV
jgi:hypothetical protein